MDNELENELRSLNALRIVLEPLVDTVDVRGQDKATFVYATHHGRAVEACFDEGEKMLVEYWEDSPDEYAPPVREQLFDSISEAQEEIINWLLQRDKL